MTDQQISIPMNPGLEFGLATSGSTTTRTGRGQLVTLRFHQSFVKAFKQNATTGTDIPASPRNFVFRAIAE
jgi:hypothetical protein